ncbi:hypothetical protein MYX84_11855 [Acidobacteria bacterium AH-259-O06]|nr:hypothetical protein [Acidobacteria bacterium AH-259-O06]
MVRFYCDGCGRLLEDQSLVDAQELAQKAKEVELFCPEQCAFRAHDYWEAAQGVKLDAAKRAFKQVENFRNKFFATRLVKAGEKAKKGAAA